MPKIIYISLLFSLLYFTNTVMAKPTVIVEAFQSPAWVESTTGIRALKTGMRVQENEQIKTGKSAKVVLRLSEGSHVKLGEDAVFAVNQLDSQQNTQQDNNIFKAAMHVLRGAFRFTTSALGKNRQRNIDIKLVTATVGIRGTDVWGRASPEQDFVCLIEGKIAINRNNEPERIMDQPLALYVANQNQIAEPTSSADIEVVNKLALETELDQGKGVINETGQYIVYLLSTQKLANAERAQEQFNQLGYATVIQTANVNQTSWYRVGISHFASLADAQYFVQKAQKTLNTNSAWAARMQGL